MKVTLIFPSYLHLSDFLSLADSGNIQMDLDSRSLTALFNENEIYAAVSRFNAEVGSLH